MLLSFKDVGKKIYREENLSTGSFAPIPIGIKTPVQFGNNSEGIFAMNFDIAEQIHCNLKDLILTNHGERLYLYQFGGNLRELTLEFTSKDDFDSEAMQRINTAVSTYMPFVSLEYFDSNPDYIDNIFTGKIKLTIIYSVSELNVFQRTLSIMLYAT